MRLSRATIWAIVFMLGPVCAPALVWAQPAPRAASRPANEDVQAGSRIFRSHCAVCHGLDASGGKGPDLTRGEFRYASSDAALLQIISDGIAGSEMPGIFFSENQIRQVMAYLRSLGLAARHQKPPGDAAAGQKIFTGKGGCNACHRIDGEGGRLGPDLSEIGFVRSPNYLKTSILAPDDVIHPRHRQIQIVTRDGRRISGLLLNEDTYSIRLLDMQENLLSFSKQELKEIRRESKSSMPAYQGVLSEQEIDDLVAYLHAQRRKMTP